MNSCATVIDAITDVADAGAGGDEVVIGHPLGDVETVLSGLFILVV